MTLAPVFLHLLADRKLDPGAVELQVGQGDMTALLPLIADQNFSTFTSTFPCFFGADVADRWPTELVKALLGAGCQMLPAGDSCLFDQQTRPELPSGVRWLSGAWYLAPPDRTQRSQLGSRSLSLKLLRLVTADADTCDIETVFRQDPVLAYHLLRLVNSLGAGVGKRISSFSQAILILGRHQLKRWLNLMLFAASRDDHRSAMLLARVAVRARSMELLARAGGLDRSVQDYAFMVGMFSLLGILFGMPLAEVLKPLKLDHALTDAVLRYEGKLGDLLLAVEKTERADETGLTALLGGMSLSITDYNLITLEAHQWMLGVIHDKEDAANA